MRCFIYFCCVFSFFFGCTTSRQRNIQPSPLEEFISENSHFDGFRVKNLLMLYEDITVYHRMAERGFQTFMRNVILHGDEDDLEQLSQLMSQYFHFTRPLIMRVAVAARFPQYQMPVTLLNEEPE